MASDDLIFLATTRMPVCRQRLDKHVVGYYTMQFMENGSGNSSVDVAYDDRWTRMENGAWFWPAYPGPRLRFQPAPGSELVSPACRVSRAAGAAVDTGGVVAHRSAARAAQP